MVKFREATVRLQVLALLGSCFRFAGHAACAASVTGEPFSAERDRNMAVSETIARNSPTGRTVASEDPIDHPFKSQFQNFKISKFRARTDHREILIGRLRLLMESHTASALRMPSKLVS